MKGLSPGRRLALVAAIGALLAGAAIAIAAGTSGHSGHRRAPGAGARIPGRHLPPVEGEAPSTRSAPQQPHNGTRSKGGAPGGAERNPRPQPAGRVPVAARYLGVPVEAVRVQLESGRTLAQIAAGRPGKSVAGLIDALVGARTAAIHAATAQGRIPKDVAARRIGRLRKLISANVQRRAGLPVLGALAPAAAYLGTDTAKLRDRLRGGHTLAQIADATPGHSGKGLVDALVATRRAALDRAVKAGRMQKSREKELLAHYRERVAQRIRLHAG